MFCRNACHLHASAFQHKIIVKIKQQVIAGHNAAGKKIFAHPVGFILYFEKISIFLMGKNMDKHLAIGF